MPTEAESCPRNPSAARVARRGAAPRARGPVPARPARAATRLDEFPRGGSKRSRSRRFSRGADSVPHVAGDLRSSAPRSIARSSRTPPRDWPRDAISLSLQGAAPRRRSRTRSARRGRAPLATGLLARGRGARRPRNGRLFPEPARFFEAEPPLPHGGAARRAVHGTSAAQPTRFATCPERPPAGAR